MAQDLTSILGAAKQKSDWATWLAEDAGRSAAETRAFLDRALTHLPERAFSRVRKRLERSDAKGIDAVLHELLAFEMCRALELNPTFEPEVTDQRPDLSLVINGAQFFADVFVTYRPTSTLRTFEGLSGYEDRGQTAKKLADAIATKASRYAKLDAPLIVFAIFGGYDVDLHDLESGLYGTSVEEAAVEGVSTIQCHEDWHAHGILCPPSSDSPHRNLSAVVGCCWFDTLNRSDRGRRLQCVVYHHWRPEHRVEIGAFRPFCDLHWRYRRGATAPLA